LIKFGEYEEGNSSGDARFSRLSALYKLLLYQQVNNNFKHFINLWHKRCSGHRTASKVFSLVPKT